MPMNVIRRFIEVLRRMGHMEICIINEDLGDRHFLQIHKVLLMRPKGPYIKTNATSRNVRKVKEPKWVRNTKRSIKIRL